MTVSNLKQAPNSGDCGYFSGYVAYLKDRYGAAFASQRVSNRDVYLARNTHWEKQNKPYERILDGCTPIQAANKTSLMLDYLNDLGIKQYKAYAANRIAAAAGLSDEKALRSLLRRYSPTAQSKNVLLLAVHPLHKGHWIAIVGISGSAGWVSAATQKRPRLKWPSRGGYVKLLQETLNKAPPSKLPKLKVDSIFGPKTYQRVLEFQRYQGLVGIDGVVGKDTWAELEPYIAETVPTVSGIQYWVFNPAAAVPTLHYEAETTLVRELARVGLLAYVARTES